MAEDSAVIQKVVQHVLSKHGHTVVIAPDGKSAPAILEAQSFDLTLMDVQMPEMDGFQVTAAIREKEKYTGAHLPIIAMTAQATEGNRERCLAMGMDGYISKPVRAEELLVAIEDLGQGAKVLSRG